MKYLLFFFPILFWGCSKDSTVLLPEHPEISVKIENTSQSKLNNITVVPYYPDSIKFSFTTADTGKNISYIINRRAPGWFFVCSFEAITTSYTYTLSLKNEAYYKFFYDAEYVISRNYFDNQKMNYSDAVAYIYINSN